MSTDLGVKSETFRNMTGKCYSINKLWNHHIFCTVSYDQNLDLEMCANVLFLLPINDQSVKADNATLLTLNDLSLCPARWLGGWGAHVCCVGVSGECCCLMTWSFIKLGSRPSKPLAIHEPQAPPPFPPSQPGPINGALPGPQGLDFPH